MNNAEQEVGGDSAFGRSLRAATSAVAAANVSPLFWLMARASAPYSAGPISFSFPGTVCDIGQMWELVRSNIRRSLRTVADRPAQLPRELVHGDVSEDSIGSMVTLGWFLNPVPPHPWFYRDPEHRIRSPQDQLFGFYDFAWMLRSELVGLRYYMAGNLLRGHGYYAAAVAVQYTAAFQLLNGLLGRFGRVFIAPVLGRPEVGESEGRSAGVYGALEDEPGVVLGVLTRDNRWIFEGRARTHAARWGELERVSELWSSRETGFLAEFLSYLCSYRGELMVEEEELAAEGLSRLAEGRHASIYEGYGFDPTAHDMVMNDEGVGGDGLGQRADAYSEFAKGLLRFNASTIIDIRDFAMEETENVGAQLAGTVLWRPFELEFSGVGDRELHELLDQSLTWLIRHAVGRSSS